MDQVRKYIDRVESALESANKDQTKLTENQLSKFTGLSGKRIRILLNELIKEDTRYLEVGTFTGSTFVSALYGNNPASATVVDSFAAGDTWEMDLKVDIEYHGIKVKNGLFLLFLENCLRNNVKNFTCIQGDCFSLPQPDKFEIRDIDTYLFDGGHTRDDHIRALTSYINNMDDVFIYIVDDWNNAEVREGTRVGIESCFLKVHKEWEIFSEIKTIDNAIHYDRNWWNGYYVAVCQKQVDFFPSEEEEDIKPIWGTITDKIGE
jgi:hypothetical protein